MTQRTLGDLGAVPRAMLFDLDGTLLDSVPDLAWSLDRALERVGLPPAGEPATRRWVGNGVDALIERALADHHCGADVAARVKQHFFELYGQHASDRSRLYPHALDTLARLRLASLRLGCVTNKPAQFTHALLRAFDLAPNFEVVVGGDSLATRKPHPEPLLHAARRLGADPAATLFVGDSATDVAAARAGGIRVVCVSYGYNFGADIADSAPDAIIDDLGAIATWVESG